MKEEPSTDRQYQEDIHSIGRVRVHERVVVLRSTTSL